jgi:hypothetical protein
MPLLGSFGAACARGLGLGNGEAPLAPSITAPANVVRTVTAVSGNGTTVTYTTSAPHGFTAGQLVTVAGITTTTAYNGSFIIADIPLTTTFTVTASTAGVGTISGDETATCNPVLETPITAAISYNITISTFPLARVEYKLDKTNASNSVTDAGQWTGTLPGASGSNSATLSTRVNSSGATENILHAQKYALYLRAVDGAGQTGPESTVGRFTTAAEVPPTAVAPTLVSTPVSGGPPPFINITWAAGTAGTYPIATRQYSVVAGTGAAGDFTTVTPSTGNVSVTTTAAGAAILPSTPSTSATYRVYMRYIASTTDTPVTAYADITTAQEVTANAITAGASITTASTGLTFDQHRTQFVITCGTVPNNTTYTQKYQYAYGTSADPADFQDFPSSGTVRSITITGQTSDTTFYVRTRAISTVTAAPGIASGNASVRLNAAFPPTPTIAFRSTMSTSSYGTAQFTISGNAGSTTEVKIVRRTMPFNDNGALFVTKGTGSQDISGYTSDGGTEYYAAYNYNRHLEQSVASNQIRWTRPAKNQGWNSGYIQPDPIYFSTTASCTSEFKYTFSSVPSTEEEPGYIAVNYLYVEGIQQTGTNLNGCSTAARTLANTGGGNIFWQSDSFHPDFTGGLGTTTTSGFSPNWGTGTFSARALTITQFGGSSISGKFFAIGTGVGSRTGACAVGCSLGTGANAGTLNAYRMKNFLISGVQTTAGSIGT